MNGSYTPKTLPVGGEETREVSPRSLAEALLVKNKQTKKPLSNIDKSFCCHLKYSCTVSVFLPGQPGELLYVIVKMGLLSGAVTL